jgi:3'(2'), 5'-bisphosphate nucleotidase
MMTFKKELEVAIQAVRKAGRKILSYYDQSYEIRYKSGNPVTEADLASEQIILNELGKFDYGIISEETADNKERLKKARTWIIDPLDGTSDFIENTDDFTVMIGLAQKGRSVLGVIYQPAKEKLYYGVKDRGSFVQKDGKTPVRLEVSRSSDLRLINILSSRFHRSEKEIKFARKFGINNFITRGSSLKICQIAEGQGDLNFNPSDKTWEYDICAADIILKEAGGRLTDLNGNDFIYNKENLRNIYGYVATNGVIHDKIIEELKKI